MSSQHIGIHVLTAYPPSNPNRDENGQPKTAIVNGVTRQRISSQCIKRAWRLSETLKSVGNSWSVRTRAIGELAIKDMSANIDQKTRERYAIALVYAFGKRHEKEPLSTSEVVVLGAEEVRLIKTIAQSLGQENVVEANIKEILSVVLRVSEKIGEKLSIKDDKKDADVRELREIVQKATASIDISMFGRMRASNTSRSVDAAMCVSHPLTTGKATIDADFWTSVDDLKLADEDADAGSGGMGDVEFGSGTYYTYVQVNRAALISNLTAGDASTAPQAKELSKQVILKLIEAIANVSPNGHKTTFGNEVRASYLRVEIGQPSGNLYCKAFEEPISGTKKATLELQAVASAEAAAFGLNQKVFEFSTSQTLASVLDGVGKELEAA
jgi:CRISPR system Cascade subunit CasC